MRMTLRQSWVSGRTPRIVVRVAAHRGMPPLSKNCACYAMIVRAVLETTMKPR